MPEHTLFARSLPRLSMTAAAGESSAIRDLLNQAKRPGMISLAGGLPDASLFPTVELAAIAAELIVAHGETVLQYGPTRGDEEARSALVSLFDDRASADDLLVTTGSQQALDLIARVMVDPGDQVVVGAPDYLGALQVFRSAGAMLVPVPVDGGGLDTAQLETQLRAGLRPKLCYVVPHFHNPTGVTMPAERRRHMHELSARYGFLVIEDDPYRQLYFGDDRPTGVPFDPEVTVRLRSTSKTLAPGLRVGAMAGPQWLIDAVTVAKQSSDLHTSTLAQAIVARAVAAPWFEPHLAHLRRVYESKRDMLVAALGASFGDALRYTVPSGGMFLWADLRSGVDTTALLQRSLDHGVCFVPGAAFGVGESPSSCLRLSYATASEADLVSAVTRLASSLL